MIKTFTHQALLITLAIAPLFASAQDEHFIYGRITLVDAKVYEGPIRWGKEEVYWNDIFNAAKVRNENLRYLSHDERQDLDDRQYNHRHGSENNWSRWADNFGWRWSDDGNFDREYTHQFSCQFGEIKSLKPQGSKWVDIELQNGMKVELSGDGYNDVGLDIRVIDSELGEVEVYWNRIQKIEFINTPGKLANRFGRPLYGTVESFGNKFTGYIQWDHDERLSVDKLDGDSDDGDLSIEFDKISSITRLGSRCRVVLKSGREIDLEGSNDVNRENRGVIVMNKDVAGIDIPWSEFDKITFEEKTPGALVSYAQYKNQKELSATVKTSEGESYSGRLVFDLDEEYDFELLQGRQRDFEYTTAFRNVKKIKSFDDDRCEVELKNGEKLMLTDGQDVNDLNQGVLIFAQGKEKPQYIPWNKVSEIEFR
ncbi:MAG TPA: hypothetical protein VK508_11045 [Cyclobacteriaceae bacterium]|nr:hypothetical protein [Cyclobacteriaceae bacterium]